MGSAGWMSDYLSDPCVRRLLDRRSLSNETVIQYLKGIRDFCEVFGLSSPSQLVEKFRGVGAEEAVKLFREYMVRRKAGLAPKSMWNWLVGVKALLVENDVEYIDEVSKRVAREFRRTVGKVRRIVQRDLITKEEIVKVLKIAPMRERALIAVLASSGLRVNAALNLKLENIKDDLYDEGLSCYCIEVPEELSKEREAYITFITWEAADYIRQWLAERRSMGEQITPKSFIFTTREGTPLSRNRFDTIWRNLCREAGIDLKPVEVPGRFRIRYNIRIHSLRKFFRTTLQISGVDRLVAEALMGHSLSSFGVESIYNYAASRLDYLRSEYMKALNNLLFLREPRGLEIMNHEARKRIEELQEKLKQVEEEKKRIEDAIAKLADRLAPRITQLEKQVSEIEAALPKVIDKIKKLTKTRSMKKRT